jgi:cytochrome c-type biogenesis protein CcmH
MSPEARQKMIQGMVDRLAKRLEDNPDNLQGWTRLARSYNVLGKPDKARRALKRASEIAPENVDVLAQYARAIRRAAGDQQTDKSIEVSRRILQIDSDHAEALWFVGVHEARQGNTEKARTLFDKALATLPDSPQTKELRRRAKEMVGDG